tara:strand:- start:17 stop:433 length:417 start_codon:yes stop_codon:yes gene_type:complete
MLSKKQISLKAWMLQKWRTKSGKKSSITGERYLPEKAIKALSSFEYRLTTKAKRKITKLGKQFSKQPKYIADKVRKYRNEWKIDNKIKNGSYTKPNLRRKLFLEIKATNTHGTKAGKWSARKAQLLAKKYKNLGGGYY